MNEAVRATEKEIFKRYPNAVIAYEFDYGEIFFFTTPEKVTKDCEYLHDAWFHNNRWMETKEIPITDSELFYVNKGREERKKHDKQ